MIAGFDIGGTKCAVILADSQDGKVTFLERREFPTIGTPESVIERLLDTLYAELKSHGLTTNELTAAGISCGGPLNGKRGLILSPPNLPGWDRVPITKIIKSRLHIPVKLCNDADACALAEWKYGAGKGTQNMVFLTFGTGLGAGLILNGKLYTGANNFAGEVGHIRLNDQGPCGYGKIGSFEGFCSGAGIAKLAKNYAEEKFQMGKTVEFCSAIEKMNDITAKSLYLAAKSGSRQAQEVFALSGKYLGRGLAIIADILNPEKIVIGGVYMRAQEFIEKAMKKSLRNEALCIPAKVKILPAGLGEKIGDYATIVAAEALDD